MFKIFKMLIYAEGVGVRLTITEGKKKTDKVTSISHRHTD